jgi:small subunit ribosomal protein S6
MLLIRPDLEDDQLQAAVERVTRAVVNAGGSLSKISPWGKRRLAYPIQHHRDASYFLIHFDIEPAAVRDIERGLLISEEILRHLVVVLEPRHRREGDAEEVDTPTYVDDAADGEPAEDRAVEGSDRGEAVAEHEAGDDTGASEDEDEPASVGAPEEVAG